MGRGLEGTTWYLKVPHGAKGLQRGRAWFRGRLGPRARLVSLVGIGSGGLRLKGTEQGEGLARQGRWEHQVSPGQGSSTCSALEGLRAGSGHRGRAEGEEEAAPASAPRTGQGMQPWETLTGCGW